MGNDVLELTRALIARPSITPEDAGCLGLLTKRLEPLGFLCRRMDEGGVSNLWATLGSGKPLFVFAGHTDVVPTGPEADWASPPFEPTERDGYLYGRGAADMKASLAAMVVAVERFVTASSEFQGTIGFLLTSDEEGPAIHGTRHVMEQLTGSGTHIDYCVVGEPSSSERLGDVVRNGRRGSLNVVITVQGVQGHVAYPEQVRNPIHLAAPALAEFTGAVWDQGNASYPPTSMQISNIHAGTGATNVVPGTLEVTANFRFSTEVTAAQLRQRTEALFQRHGLECRFDWALSGEPFLTEPGAFTDTVLACIEHATGVAGSLSTSGGTSDGRFIAPTGAQLVELGPVNATIHKIDECVAIADLEPLASTYQTLLARLLPARP